MTSPGMQWRRQPRGTWVFLVLPVVVTVCIIPRMARAERQLDELYGWAERPGGEGGAPRCVVSRPARLRGLRKPERTWQQERMQLQSDLRELAPRVERSTRAVTEWQRTLASRGNDGRQAKACAALLGQLTSLERQRVQVSRRLDSARGWEDVDAEAREVGRLWERARHADTCLRGQRACGIGCAPALSRREAVRAESHDRCSVAN